VKSARNSCPHIDIFTNSLYFSCINKISWTHSFSNQIIIVLTSSNLKS
jgi:hypothetical protein